MTKELLLPMKLQFFAEGEGETVSETTQEAAAPETETTVETTDNGEGATEEVTEPQPQSAETNRAFADMRRRMDAAESSAADLDAQFASQFGQYTNPETGQPIRNASDYIAAMAAQERVKAREELKANNINPELIDNLIANSPIVRQAQAATNELNNYRAQQQLESDYKKIMEIDPTVHSQEDILNDPSMDLILQKVSSGMSLVDAYKIVNFDRLKSSTVGAAKQAAINSVKGKNHLATGAALNVDDGSEDIPAAQLEMYKETFPDKTIKEIKALYNKALSARR